MKKYDLLCIGDATLDVFLSIHEASVFCDIDTERCVLTLSYADKIPVDRLDFAVGGNATNTAVGTTKLGIATGLVTQVGEDDTGERIKNRLQEAGVDTSLINIVPGGKSHYSVIISFAGERTILSYRYPQEYHLPQLPKAEWVYLTSTGRNFPEIYAKVAEFVKKGGAKLAFNPGTRQIKAGLSSWRDILPLTQVLFLNKDEAREILQKPKVAPKELLSSLLDLGPESVIVTDAERGSFAAEGKKFYQLGVLPVEPAERTGAGDAFAAGVLAAQVLGKSLEEALSWGTIEAASVITKIGSQEGLLTREELEERVERAKLTAREF